MKKKIAIISSSVRIGRLSHRVALYSKSFVEQNTDLEVDLIDLKEYNFPIFDERLANMKQPSKEVLEYAERFKKADGVIIVTPVYNSSFPASLKNVIDLLYAEWAKKPVALVVATFGRVQPIATTLQLQGIMCRLNARVVSPAYNPTEIEKIFNENGELLDARSQDRLIAPVIEELEWMVGRE